MLEDAGLEVTKREMEKRAGSRRGKRKEEPSGRMEGDRQREQARSRILQYVALQCQGIQTTRVPSEGSLLPQFICA